MKWLTSASEAQDTKYIHRLQLAQFRAIRLIDKTAIIISETASG